MRNHAMCGRLRVGIYIRLFLVSFSMESMEAVSHGLVDISCPVAATPMTVETPQPLWQASSAARIT